MAKPHPVLCLTCPPRDLQFSVEYVVRLLCADNFISTDLTDVILKIECSASISKPFHHLRALGNMTVWEFVLKSNFPSDRDSSGDFNLAEVWVTSVSFYICISMIDPSLLLNKKKMQLLSYLFVIWSWSVNCDVFFSLRMWSQLRSLLSVWWSLMNSGTKKWPISASGRRRTGLALR